MAGRASKEKGKRGERDFRDKIREHGFIADRGWADAVDIKCPGLPYHFEVKFVERLDLRAAYDQSRSKCGDRTPVVAHRTSYREWMITLSADDFLKLVKK